MSHCQDTNPLGCDVPIISSKSSIDHPKIKKSRLDFTCNAGDKDLCVDHPNLRKRKVCLYEMPKPVKKTAEKFDPCNACNKCVQDYCKSAPKNPCPKPDPCCKPPKPDPCNPCKPPKPNPCKPDPCNPCKPPKPDPCNPCKKEDPCKKKEDPCKKDPCKKDPCPCPAEADECSKKFKKLKFQVEKHNYDMDILRKQISKLEAKKRKTEADGKRLCCMKTDLNRMKEELERMVQVAMKEQETSEMGKWGRIPLATDSEDFQVNMFGPAKITPCATPRLPENDSELSCISGFSDLDLQDQLVCENQFLECDRYELQESLLMKDRMLDVLNQRIKILECKVREVCRENMDLMEQAQCPRQPQPCKSKQQDSCQKTPDCNTGRIQEALALARCEIENLKREKEALENCRKSSSKLCDPDYNELLQKYQEREEDCKRLMQKLKCKESECDGDKTRAENSFLKKRSDELANEVDEYKILNQELSEQLDLYRSKFLKAQEKAEEQKLRLEKLEENNRLIEGQVNEEICRIQRKFQEKLQELCPYPKKLEEAKKELKESNCQVEKLENDLKATIAELCKAKTQLKKLQENPDEKLEQKNLKLLAEIEQLKQKHCTLKNTKECLEEKLKCMNMELENLRKESVKIITTTKQCSNRNRDILHEHIDCLEAELSKTRASAALALQEKECTIQKMQEQLQDLCNKFGDAQGQIRELKNHVTCLSKKKHSVCPEDFNRIDYCA